MLILLSPAKALDFDKPHPRVAVSQPRMLDQSRQLVEVMRGRSVSELAALSGISDELAALNAGRWAAYTEPFTTRNARPAVFAFDGEAYRGLAAAQRFTTRDYTEAQKTLRLLSGLYGVLRPLDLIQAYRLEMGTRLVTSRGDRLYDWWGELITDQLRRDLDESPGPSVVINLASAEYFGAVDPQRLGATVISPRFEDLDARGRRGVVSFYAKRARGELASWLIRNRVRRVGLLAGFAEIGYRYDRAVSSPQAPVFVRRFEDRT